MSYGGGDKCPKCGKTVYHAEKAIGAGQTWHKMCFSCTDCNKKLDSTSLKEHEGKLYCGSCHARNFGPKGYGYGGGAGVLSTDGAIGSKPVSETAFRPAGNKSVASKFGGADKCPRCGKSVYSAEKIIGAGQSWHKSCFSCKECRKKLDSTSVADREGEIYCKSCYGKQYGPKGYGYGAGAGALVNTK